MPRIPRGIAANVVKGWAKSNTRKGSCFSPGSAHDRLCHHLHKILYIFLRGIERAHPAHDALLLDPGIEEIPLLDLRHGLPRNLREHSVGLDLPHDLDLRNPP